MAASVSVIPRQKAAKSYFRQNEAIEHRKPTNPQLQEIRFRSFKSGNVGLWAFIEWCGFCVFQCLNPCNKPTNPQDPCNPRDLTAPGSKY